MDNLAHSLVGLAVSKAGLEKLSPGATSVCILAANAPDLDFISALSADRWTVLHYHRGITHSIVGTLVLALVIPALFFLGDRAIARTRGQPGRLSFIGLLLASLVASATHPLLDWTNNYGIRLLLPWSGKWFYGDLVFVVDPFLWLIFGAAAFLLTSKSKRQVALWMLLGAALTVLVVYGAINARVLDHPGLVLSLWIVVLMALVISSRIGLGPRYGRKIAQAAFVISFAYWGALGLLHSRALARAGTEAAALAAKNGERVIRLAAMPTLGNPSHWRCIAETDQALYRFEVFLDVSDPGSNLAASNVAPYDLVRYAKPTEAATGVITSAMPDRRTQIFFEFARFPVERVVGVDCATQTLVQFADLRYTEPGKARGAFSLELPVDCPGLTTPTDGR